MRQADSISVVLPAYNEATNLTVLIPKLENILQKINIPIFEIIVVDDGSVDATCAVVKNLASNKKNIKLIRLSKNSGHQIACFTGIIHANGEVIVTMDSDLQHPPGKIPEMYALWQSGYDIVNSVRLETQGISLFKRLFSSSYYLMYNLFSKNKLIPNTADFRLIDRTIAREIYRCFPQSLFLRGFMAKQKISQAFVEYIANKRFSGSPGYSLIKLFHLAIVGFLSSRDSLKKELLCQTSISERINF